MWTQMWPRSDTSCGGCSHDAEEKVRKMSLWVVTGVGGGGRARALWSQKRMCQTPPGRRTPPVGGLHFIRGKQVTNFHPGGNALGGTVLRRRLVPSVLKIDLCCCRWQGRRSNTPTRRAGENKGGVPQEHAGGIRDLENGIWTVGECNRA